MRCDARVMRASSAWARAGFQGLISPASSINAGHNGRIDNSSQLLAAFSPGYRSDILTQIPGGLAAQRAGGKAVMTWISYFQMAMLLALPAAAIRLYLEVLVIS